MSKRTRFLLRIPVLFCIAGALVFSLSLSMAFGVGSGVCGASVREEIATGQFTLTCNNADQCPELVGNCPFYQEDHNGVTYKTCKCPGAVPEVICNVGMPLTPGNNPICLKPTCAENYECKLKDVEVPQPPDPARWRHWSCECEQKPPEVE